MSIGVPIKVLHEAEGHIVTCETNTGEVYRGKLIEAEDNMNCQVSYIHLHCVDQYIGGYSTKANPYQLSHPFKRFKVIQKLVVLPIKSPLILCSV